MNTLSEIEDNKRKIAESLARFPGGIERYDLYLISGLSEEAFKQAFNELKDDYFIRQVTFGVHQTFTDGYMLTDSGIDRYSLKAVVDSSRLPDYIPRDDSEYVKVISQDTQYGATRTGVKLAPKQSKLTKERRRGIIFICACVIGFIAIGTIIIVFVL